MGIPRIAKNVNVLIPPLESQLLCLANFPNGKVMAGVMMATTMLDAPLMVVIVVEMMSRPLTAKSVNVFNKMSSKNSRLMLGTRGKIRNFQNKGQTNCWFFPLCEEVYYVNKSNFKSLEKKKKKKKKILKAGKKKKKKKKKK